MLVTSVGVVVSSWVALPVAAKADVYLRLVTLDGDGTATSSTAIGNVTLQVR